MTADEKSGVKKEEVKDEETTVNTGTQNETVPNKQEEEKVNDKEETKEADENEEEEIEVTKEDLQTLLRNADIPFHHSL